MDEEVIPPAPFRVEFIYTDKFGIIVAQAPAGISKIEKIVQHTIRILVKILFQGKWMNLYQESRKEALNRFPPSSDHEALCTFYIAADEIQLVEVES
jgi:hypothetical protein